MPRKLEWSPPRDAVLCRLRAEGAGWEAIAAELAISRNAAIERGRRLGARLPPMPREPAPPDPNREPLAAGSVESWEPLVAGSMLEGCEYVWANPMTRNLGDPRPPAAPIVQSMIARTSVPA